MGIQETAQDVKHLVQALADGKELEYRGKGGKTWSEYGPSDGELLFYLAEFDYRIKRDLREELFELVRKYGAAHYERGLSEEAGCADAAHGYAVAARKAGEALTAAIDELLGEKK